MAAWLILFFLMIVFAPVTLGIFGVVLTVGGIAIVGILYVLFWVFVVGLFLFVIFGIPMLICKACMDDENSAAGLGFVIGTAFIVAVGFIGCVNENSPSISQPTYAATVTIKTPPDPDDEFAWLDAQADAQMRFK